MLGYRAGMVSSVIVLGINQAWMPYYMKIMKKSEGFQISGVGNSSECITGIVGLVCLLAVLFSREILSVLNRKLLQIRSLRATHSVRLLV